MGEVALVNVSKQFSLRLGRDLRWDPKAERFLDNDRANAMLSREARPRWRLA